MAEGTTLFSEGIDFLKGKVNLPTARWDDLRHAAHVRAFSVAGITRDDMLTDFRVAIEKARAGEITFADFRQTFDEIVDRTGWRFNARGSTEEERRAWRARIIYTTNMRTSYMAGRYAQLTDPDVQRYRPYWQYLHSHALHPRVVHLSWDGKIWRADNPIWKIIYPPNGWGCGCDVKALSERQMRALGKSGPDPDPDLAPYDAKDPRTGQTETRYRGIDRGWEYNVGQEWLQGVVPTELREPLPSFGQAGPVRALPAMPEPKAVAASDLLPKGQEPTDYVKAFLEPFGIAPGEDTTFRDKSGAVIGISQAMFESRTPTGEVLGFKADKRGRGQYARLLALAIIDPDEIWVDWVKVTSGVVLRRAYLSRVSLPDGRSLLIRFEWTKYGWTPITAFETTDRYLVGGRAGALLYRKK